ncbi:MAG: universal stress protein [Euryarchaeota archaeon]|nr:universal stress protein [Euryarchaeota archaeon]
MERILVAFDGSDSSVRALNQGAKIAERMGAELSLVYVVNLGDIYYQELLGKPEFTEVLESLKREGKIFDDFLAESGRKVLETAKSCLEGSVQVTREIVKIGHPAEEIINAAKEVNADLIVLGPHSKRRTLLMGSVSKEVVERAPCSVLVVR